MIKLINVLKSNEPKGEDNMARHEEKLFEQMQKALDARYAYLTEAFLLVEKMGPELKNIIKDGSSHEAKDIMFGERRDGPIA